MRAVVQRVKESFVKVGDEVVGKIGKGLLVLLGVAVGDSEEDSAYLSRKIAHLRIFEDDLGLMNRSVLEVGGEVLVVSQFTLLGDCRKGRRPSFAAAAEPAKARLLYEGFLELLRREGIRAAEGRFQETMEVHLVNDGPVTVLLDSSKAF
jgi:D-tyrosyl-tRNA(Tyr) deacylase